MRYSINKMAGAIITCFFVCIPIVSALAYCGDGILQEHEGEECDDGNNINRDGCSAYCKIEDMDPPSVESVSIPNLSTGVDTLTDTLKVVFSEAMKASSINKTSVRFEHAAKPLDFTLNLEEDQKTLTISIGHELYSEATHSLRIKNVSDSAGNLMTDEFISIFTTAKSIDRTPPNVVVSPSGGTYNFAQDVSLTPYIGSYTKSDDFIDKTAKIYYTLNDSNISEKSTLYSSTIPIRENTTLRYLAIDDAGNRTPVITEIYIFKCPDFPNAKAISDRYPECKILECNIGFILRSNSCVPRLGEASPDDYKTNAVTAPLFTSDTPMTITSKPSIYITPQHKGIIPRPIIFKDPKRGTIINFEKNTKLTDSEGQPFTGYIKPPENLYMKNFPTNFGYSFRSIFQFKADDGRDLSFLPAYKITIPYGENFNPNERVTVFTYDPNTKKYTEYSRGLYSSDLDKKTVAIASFKTGMFFIAQAATNYNKAAFTDVSVSHWAKNYIEELYQKGIVQGRDNGIFAPNENLTRAEFLKITLNSIGVSIDSSESIKKSPFEDVPLYAWYAPYVAKAKSLGLIAGHPDGTFAPDDNINRAEAVKILFTAFNFNLTKKPISPPAEAKQRFIDLKNDTWYFPYADFAIQNGIIEGTPSPNNTFRYFKPGESITRAEMAKLAIKAMELTEELKK